MTSRKKDSGPSLQFSLTYARREITVDVILSNRKSIAITVHPDLHVTARAPKNYKADAIHRKLAKRARWIVKHLEYFEQFHPLPPTRQFVSGETHYYLGRQYRLRIRKSAKSRVRLIGRFFEMELPEPNNQDMAKKVMLDWYSSHARELLTRRMQQYLPYYTKLGVTEPHLRLRRMKRRWGSCSSKGIVTLNTELVKAPIHCVDYVIVHEMSHLIYLHHDKKFYRLLARIMPDWEQRKERLERVIL